MSIHAQPRYHMIIHTRKSPGAASGLIGDVFTNPLVLVHGTSCLESTDGDEANRVASKSYYKIP
jgi:hypothetical protein